MAEKPVPNAADGETPPPLPWLEEMPPRQIVAELDRYIVGQDAAKRAIAIAVRNRWRRSQAPESIRDKITPSNLQLELFRLPHRRKPAAPLPHYPRA